MILTRAGLNRKAVAEEPEHQITRVYLLVLGRAPDAEGLRYWVGMLRHFDASDSRPEGLAHIIGQFAKSPELPISQPHSVLLRRLTSWQFEDLRTPEIGYCVRKLTSWGYSAPHIYGDLAQLMLNPSMIRVMEDQVARALQQL